MRPRKQLVALLFVSCICWSHASRHLQAAEQSAAQLQSLQNRAFSNAPVKDHTGQEPGIELAARQLLFNYGAQQGLGILTSRVQDLVIPDIAKTFNLPIVGEFALQLSNIKIPQFNASSDEAKLNIMDGRFELWVTQVEAEVTFQWHWQKLGMSGTGTGALLLHGGSIDYQFRVTTSELGKPHIIVDDSNSKFSSVELQIKSFSADWLYQAVMSLFNDQIQKALQNGIAQALQNDVPESMNHVLDTVPTKLDITGLPFSTTFEYSIFTLTYVMVKGYGEVESNRLSPRLRRLLSGAAMDACPYTAAPLPLTSEQVAADSHMISIYLHQAVINCMLWGLFHGGAMKFSLQDGTIPKLHLTTDLLAMLIPQLPKDYPHQFLRIEAEALEAPQISFSAAEGTTIQAAYRTSIFVANETAGNPKIATLSARLTVKGQVNYDSTIITAVQAVHTVEESSMPVSAPQWDNTIAWFIQNYAGLFPLQILLNKVVSTPVTSLVSLVNAAAESYDGWFTLSGDVQIHMGQPRQA